MEGVIGCRHAAVNRRLQQHFLDLIAGDTVVECGADVQPEFVGPGMVSAMRLPSAGGVDASWAPVTISVGRSIRDRVAHWSMSRTAAHEATYPSAGLAMSMARIRRTVSAAASRNRGVNQTSMSASAMPLTPPLLTASMRAFHRSAEPIL